MKNEPVAWMIMQDGKSFFANKFEVMQPNGFDKCIPLYTHPSKDVTDEEILNTLNSVEFEKMVTADDLFYMFARAILRKANEK